MLCIGKCVAPMLGYFQRSLIKLEAPPEQSMNIALLRIAEMFLVYTAEARKVFVNDP
jgi:hypothetical protein